MATLEALQYKGFSMARIYRDDIIMTKKEANFSTLEIFGRYLKKEKYYEKERV